MSTDNQATPIPAESPSNQKGVVSVNGVKYAVNILWDAEGKASDLKNNLLARAGQISSNLYCPYKVHLGKGYQYGLADSQLGHAPSMKVLAPLVAKETLVSRLGAWKTDDGAWIILGIREDGLVLVDSCLLDEEDAKLELLSSLSLEMWNEICCPADWNVSGAIPDTALSSYIGKGNDRVVEIVKNYKKLVKQYGIPVVIVIVVIVAGLYFYNKHLENVKNEQMQEFIQQQQAISDHRREELSKTPRAPWFNQIKPTSFLMTCTGLIKQHQLDLYSFPGWVADSKLQCDSSGLNAMITSSFGTRLWLKSLGSYISPKPNLASLGDNQERVNWPLPSDSLNQVYKDSTLIDYSLNDIQAYLSEVMGETFIPITFTDMKADSVGDNTNPRPYWVSRGFSFSTTADPKMFTQLFDSVHGLVIKSVNCDVVADGSCNWTINGVFSATR